MAHKLSLRWHEDGLRGQAIHIYTIFDSLTEITIGSLIPSGHQDRIHR